MIYYCLRVSIIIIYYNIITHYKVDLNLNYPAHGNACKTLWHNQEPLEWRRALLSTAAAVPAFGVHSDVTGQARREVPHWHRRNGILARCPARMAGTRAGYSATMPLACVCALAALAAALPAALPRQLDLGVHNLTPQIKPHRLAPQEGMYTSMSAAPELHQEGYYTVPSAQELAAMPVQQLRAVRGFRVGRVGYGEIRWLDEIDVTSVDIDAVVSIEHGDISVYSDTSSAAKPPVGTKLNKPALLVLERITPPKRLSAEKFTRALERSLQGVGATSMSYQADAGSPCLPALCRLAARTTSAAACEPNRGWLAHGALS